MIGNEIRGLPVVEDDTTWAEIITEKDVLRLFYAEEEQSNKAASFFMTRLAVHYKESDSLQSICDFMMVNYFRRVPAVPKQGKVIGIISRPDILKYIRQQRQESVGMAC